MCVRVWCVCTWGTLACVCARSVRAWVLHASQVCAPGRAEVEKLRRLGVPEQGLPEVLQAVFQSRQNGSAASTAAARASAPASGTPPVATTRMPPTARPPQHAHQRSMSAPHTLAPGAAQPAVRAGPSWDVPASSAAHWHAPALPAETTATALAPPASARPRPHAPVATPPLQPSARPRPDPQLTGALSDHEVVDLISDSDDE
jgi:hypothetical protein